jgi:hypothetical protein
MLCPNTATLYAVFAFKLDYSLYLFYTLHFNPLFGVGVKTWRLISEGRPQMEGV